MTMMNSHANRRSMPGHHCTCGKQCYSASPSGGAYCYLYFVSHIMDLRSYLTLDRYPAKTYCHWLPLRGSSSGTVYRSLYTQPVAVFRGSDVSLG